MLFGPQQPHVQALAFSKRGLSSCADTVVLFLFVLEPPMQRDLSSFVEINRLTKNHVILVDSIKNLAFRKNITGTVKQRENNWNDKEMGFAGVCGYLLAFAGYLRAFCG